MPKHNSKSFNLGLKGKNIDELRMIAVKFASVSVSDSNQMDKNGLLNLLTMEVEHNPRLEREVKKSSVSIKPSFYLMVLTLKVSNKLSLAKAKLKIEEQFQKNNEEGRDKTPIHRGFALEDAIEHSMDVLEFQFSWQHIHWYWEPMEVSLNHIYEFRFGFAILDFKSRKSIIACQSEIEREFIRKALVTTYPITLTPLVLTKPLLNQIGTYDHVKRAGYFIPRPDPDTPMNITYADENLGTKRAAALLEENDQYSSRKHSFYLIPLGSIAEQGVGVTSDSGKIWIPREIPLNSVRQYGIELLKKIGATLDLMSKNKEYSKVLESLGIPRLPEMSKIKNVSLKNQISFLIQEITHMLLRKESQRQFEFDISLAIDGTPSMFEYPRLMLKDETTNETSYWKNSDGTSQLIKIKREKNSFNLTGFPYGESVDLDNLVHPITNQKIKIDDLASVLFLVPTPDLQKILSEAITYISQHIHQVGDVQDISFYISGRQLHIIDHTDKKTALLNVLIEPKSVNKFRQVLQNQPTSKERKNLLERLVSLGEKCGHMNDRMCQSCLLDPDNKRICLRSLVARYLENALLLAHKGIELSDLQGTAKLSQEHITVYGFAKLATGKDGLTARNKNGAILLAQVFGQIEKTDFDTVMVISPSTINEDLRSRLFVLCKVFRKRLLILDEIVLTSLIIDFEFDNDDYLAIYKNSKKKLTHN